MRAAHSHLQQQSQKGSATIIALIVVSLIAICASSLIWQQDFELRKTQIFKEKRKKLKFFKNFIIFSIF